MGEGCPPHLSPMYLLCFKTSNHLKCLHLSPNTLCCPPYGSKETLTGWTVYDLQAKGTHPLSHVIGKVIFGWLVGWLTG